MGVSLSLCQWGFLQGPEQGHPHGHLATHMDTWPRTWSRVHLLAHLQDEEAMGPYEGNKAENRGRGGRLRGGSPEGTPSNWGGGSVAKRLGSRAAVPGDAAWFWGCGWC